MFTNQLKVMRVAVTRRRRNSCSQKAVVETQKQQQQQQQHHHHHHQQQQEQRRKTTNLLINKKKNKSSKQSIIIIDSDITSESSSETSSDDLTSTTKCSSIPHSSMRSIIEREEKERDNALIGSNSIISCQRKKNNYFLPFQTVKDAVDSWECILQIQNYQDVLGSKLLQNLIELDPSIIENISSAASDDDNNKTAAKTMKIAKCIISNVNNAIVMLGPDLNPFEKFLQNDIHQEICNVGFIKPSHYPILIEALYNTIIDSISEIYKRISSSTNLEQSWMDILTLSLDILLQHNQNTTT